VRIVEVLPKGIHAVSGVIGAIAELSVVLSRAGHDVVLIAPGGWPHQRDEDKHRLVESGVQVVEVDGGSYSALARTTRAEIKRAHADVLHLHNGFSPLNNLIAIRPPCPYVVTPHGVYAPEGMRRSRWRKHLAVRVAERPLLRRAAAVTALTQTEASEITSLAPRATVVNAPIGFAAADPDVNRAAFRRELGLDDSTLLAVFAGRFDVFHKRLDDAVNALTRAPSWHLALVGAAHEGGSLAELARRLGVEQRVHWVAPRTGKKLAEALAGGDVALLISRSEGLPRGLIEAMAYGVPALVSPEVDTRIGVADRGAGWVATPDQLHSVLIEIETLDRSVRSLRAERARAFAERFDWDALAPTWERVFDAVKHTSC
jgi:glycosyltransferase involved in cell wall biosynthesis